MDVKKQTAPCGIDCFNCELHEDVPDNDVRNGVAAHFNVPVEDVKCAGCRSTVCSILKLAGGQECETRKCIEKKGVDFCYECSDFPCTMIMPMKEGADRYPHNFKLYNLCRIKNVGLEAWSREAMGIRDLYFNGTFGIGTGPQSGK